MTKNSEVVSVVGDGAWMRMTARLASKNGLDVLVWPGVDSDGTPHAAPNAIDSSLADAMNITVTDDPARCAESRLIFLATESWRMRATALALADHLRGYHRLVHTVRGLESTSLMRASELLLDQTPVRQIAALVGPTHPELHEKGQPGSCVVGSRFPDLIKQVQRTLESDFFRVYGNTDVVGVEISAAAARVIAVGVGMIDGLGLGPASRGTLAARGVAEIARVVAALDGNPATASGLAGLGYLVAESSEPVGGDVRIGRALVQGASPEQIQDEFGPDAVELFCAASALARAIDALGITAHIIPTVEKTLTGQESVAEAVRHLLTLAQMME